eukprot:1329282-Rhodomonas_salina.2
MLLLAYLARDAAAPRPPRPPRPRSPSAPPPARQAAPWSAGARSEPAPLARHARGGGYRGRRASEQDGVCRSESTKSRACSSSAGAKHRLLGGRDRDDGRGLEVKDWEVGACVVPRVHRGVVDDNLHSEVPHLAQRTHKNPESTAMCRQPLSESCNCRASTLLAPALLSPERPPGTARRYFSHGRLLVAFAWAPTETKCHETRSTPTHGQRGSERPY